jgi:hypothetical protein
MIEQILQGLFPYDNYGDTTARSVDLPEGLCRLVTP